VVARLVRFYGGDPMQWLARTPLAVVMAMAEMLPILQAEESLARYAEIATGSGTAGQDGAKRTFNAWKRIAEQGSERRAPKATPTTLALMGVGLTIVKPAPKPPQDNPATPWWEKPPS
jgi:hypothetical protein